MSGLLLAAALAACAVLVFAPPPRARSVRMQRARAPGGPPASHSQGRAVPPDLPSAGPATGLAGRPVQRAAAGTLGLGVWVVAGGVVGVVLGVVVAVVMATLLGRLETAAQRRERLAIAADAPVAAELLSAALAAGVPVESALPVVAEAIGGPLGQRVRFVSRLLALGQPAASAWTRLGTEESLRPLVAAASRSARTGAPLAELLASSAEELRQRSHDAARVEIRAAAVRSLLPLGLCLLPAFVLLGVVPLVGGLMGRVWG